MAIIVVANPKGGVGKSTLSTNLAGHYASRGEWTALGDLDPQRSSRSWLALRPATLPLIEDWDVDPEEPTPPPQSIEHAVLDTPAAVHGKRLAAALSLGDRIVVPLQPSMFDILATREFLARLATEKAVRRGAVAVGIVGMRVDPRTRSADQLHRFVDGLGLPVLGFLRDTQNYVQLAAHGLTLWDIPPSRAGKDIEQWQPIIDWLDSAPG